VRSKVKRAPCSAPLWRGSPDRQNDPTADQAVRRRPDQLSGQLLDAGVDVVAVVRRRQRQR
jgi:hypothetical protein